MGETDAMPAVLRILLVDDHQLMRDGLRTLLEMEEGITVGGEAADGAAAVAAFGQLLPDVVLMDIRMPVMDGVEATRRIRGRSPEAKILMLTTFDEDELVFEATEAEAPGVADAPGVAEAPAGSMAAPPTAGMATRSSAA